MRPRTENWNQDNTHSVDPCSKGNRLQKWQTFLFRPKCTDPSIKHRVPWGYQTFDKAFGDSFVCEAITGIKCVMCPEASADCVTNHRFHTDNTVAVDTSGGPLWKAERSIATLCYKSTWADLKTTQSALSYSRDNILFGFGHTLTQRGSQETKMEQITMLLSWQRLQHGAH